MFQLWIRGSLKMQFYQELAFGLGKLISAYSICWVSVRTRVQIPGMISKQGRPDL